MINKNGSITDTIGVSIFLLVAAITAILGMYIWISFSTNFMPIAQAIDSPNNETVVATVNGITQGIAAMDYMFPLLVGGAMLISLVFAFKTGASVIYAFISIFFWAFAMLMAVVFNNIFVAFAAAVPPAMGYFPIVNFIFTNIKWVVLAWLFLISIVMFTRNKKEEEAISASEAVFG